MKVAWGRGAWEGVRENLQFQAEDFMLRSMRSCQRVENSESGELIYIFEQLFGGLFGRGRTGGRRLT